MKKCRDSVAVAALLVIQVRSPQILKTGSVLDGGTRHDVDVPLSDWIVKALRRSAVHRPGAPAWNAMSRRRGFRGARNSARPIAARR
jgi:hypothetical protein